MVDGSDFDVEAIRWAITTGLVKSGNVADPASGTKDAGYANGAPLPSADINNRMADTYMAVRYLVEDVLQNMFPWNGLLPGQDELESTDLTFSQSPPAPATLNLGAQRYWLGGQIVSMDALSGLSVSSNPTGVNRVDYLAVEVTAGVGTYVVLDGAGSTPPTPAANQYPVFRFETPFNNPTPLVPVNQVPIIYQPRVRPPVRRYTVRMGVGHGFFTQVDPFGVSGELVDFTTQLAGTFDPDAFKLRILLGSPVGRGWATFPVEIPVGGRCTEVRVIGLKDAPAAVDEGYEVNFKVLNTETGVAVNLASGNNIGTALSASPYTITLTPDKTRNPQPIDSPEAFWIGIAAAPANDDDADNPSVWAVEYDIEVLSANLTEF